MTHSYNDLPRSVRRKLERDQETAKRLMFKAYAKISKVTFKLSESNPQSRAVALAAVTSLKRAVELDRLAMVGFGVVLLPAETLQLVKKQIVDTEDLLKLTEPGAHAAAVQHIFDRVKKQSDPNAATSEGLTQ